MLRSRHPLGQGLPVIKPSSGATKGRARSPLGRIRGDTERFRPFMTVHARGPSVRSHAHRKAHTAPFGRDRPSRRDGNGLSARHPEQPDSAPWIRGRGRRPVRQVSTPRVAPVTGPAPHAGPRRQADAEVGRRPTVHADDQHRRPACRPARTLQAPVRAVSDSAPCGLRTRVAAAGRARGGKCPARRPRPTTGPPRDDREPVRACEEHRRPSERHPAASGPPVISRRAPVGPAPATRAHRADDRLRHPRTGAVRVPDRPGHRRTGVGRPHDDSRTTSSVGSVICCRGAPWWVMSVRMRAMVRPSSSTG